MDSTPGGGSAPDVKLPSYAVALRGSGTSALAARLRRGEPSVVARLEDDALLFDVRTLLPGDEDRVVGRF